MSKVRGFFGLAIFSALGCSGAPAAQPAPRHAEKPAATPEKATSSDADPAITPLRSGALAPIDHPEPLRGHLLGRCFTGDTEFLEVELPDSARPTPGDVTSDTLGDSFWGQSSRALDSTALVALDPGSDGKGAGFGFALFGDNDDGHAKQTKDLPKSRLWLRRPKASTGNPISAELFVASRGSIPGQHFVVKVPLESFVAIACKDSGRYGRALRRYLSLRDSSSFGAFAADRLSSVFGAPNTASKGDSMGSSRDTELVDLMQLASGIDSVEAALQRQRQLHTGLDRQQATVPLASIKGPRLTTHPWAEMLTALHQQATPEPLADAAPADFYFVRARDIGGLFKLLDESDTWLSPLFGLLDPSSGNRELVSRYETALGLKRSAWSRVLGPTLIEEVGLVGSDPFLSLGSDLTLLFRVKNETAFNAQLASTLSDYEHEHGATTRTETTHEGITIELRESLDRAIHRYSARVTGLMLVSNSLAATKRVISTALGKAPALANELDFQYMLARDANVENTVLAYLGDQFIERAVSPPARIQSARRLIAQSELLRPGYAALLYGWLNGHQPTTLNDLNRSKLLLPSDLKHFDGKSIHFEVGQAPTSDWGSPQSMTPLIDLPELTKVTPRERDAYGRFRSEYESLWSEAVDPIALRLQIKETGDITAFSAKLRILPLVREHEYREVQELVGDVRLAPGSVQNGLRALFGIASDSELRRELTGTSQSFLGQHFGLDWLGSWGMLGLGDRNAVANAFAETSEVPEPPIADQGHDDELETLSKLPIYLGFDVKSGAGAAVALAVVREKLADASLSWQPDQEYRSFKIHEVRSNDFKAARLFYVLTNHAIYFSLSEAMIHQLVDAEIAGQVPNTGSEAQKQGQFAIDFSARSGGGLLTSLIWAFEQEAREHLNAAAERADVLFNGAPETTTNEAAFRKLAQRYFGAIPTTSEGKLFQFTKSGASDGLRGNAFAPLWPTLPIQGSPLTQALEKLGTLRAQLAFDREPGLPVETGTSLAVSVDLTERHAKP